MQRRQHLLEAGLFAFAELVPTRPANCSHLTGDAHEQRPDAILLRLPPRRASHQ